MQAEIYTMGGCTSCGSMGSLWKFLCDKGICDPIQKNAQRTSVRQEAYDRAKAISEEQPYFPMVFIGERAIMGFKPDEIEEAINILNGGIIKSDGKKNTPHS